MATSGARGSMDNLAMMAGSIGQPKVRGKRLERGYQDRVLAHFPRGGKEIGRAHVELQSHSELVCRLLLEKKKKDKKK